MTVTAPDSVAAFLNGRASSWIGHNVVLDATPEIQKCHFLVIRMLTQSTLQQAVHGMTVLSLFDPFPLEISRHFQRFDNGATPRKTKKIAVPTAPRSNGDQPETQSTITS